MKINSVPTLIKDSGEIKRVYEFVKQFPLDYPRYDEWLKKCKRELELGYKTGFYITNNQGCIIGSVIFQPHKKDKSILEIKNLRVFPQYQRRGVGSKLLTETEKYARKKGFLKMQVDTHSDNQQLVKFLVRKGFNIETREHLYTSKSLEIILQKEV